MMKRFLIHFSFFIIPLVTFFLVAEFYARSYNTVMSQKKAYLVENAEDIEILILGTSHMANGINPNQLELHAFNAANGSQSLYFDIEITKKYLPKMESLKYVFIGIDYHSLYFTHKRERDFMYSHYYGIDYKEEQNIKSDISLFYYGYGFKEGLKLFFKSPPKVEKGYGGYYNTNYQQLTSSEGKMRVKGFDEKILENNKYRTEIIESLNNFIKILKNKYITPVLVTMTCHDNFNNYLNPETLKQNLMDIEHLSIRHDLKHLDYQYLELDDDFFYNVNHLNNKGAEHISDLLNREIQILESNSSN